MLALLCIAQADPPPGKKWVPIPELTDEFEGSALDPAKWYDHNPTWKGRQPALFSKGNVGVSGGRLCLTAREEMVTNAPAGYHTFTTAAVQSKALVKYGFFEIKCLPMKSRASSAFWFYHSTKEEWTEIDVFEICGAGEKWKRKYNMNVHVFHAPGVTNHISFGGEWIAPFVFTEEDHIYSLEWDRDRIVWRVDDVVVRELKNTYCHQPLSMNFDSETMPQWFGLPAREDLPSTFSIDYVRSWKCALVRD